MPHAGNASNETLFRAFSGTALVYRDKNWLTVDSMRNGEVIAHPLGGSIKAYPATSNEVVTMPRQIPGLSHVSVFIALSPPQVNSLWQEHGRQMVAGGIDPVMGMRSFYEKLRVDPGHWLSEPPGSHREWLIWTSATGSLRKRKVRLTCRPTSSWWMTTVSPFVTAALRIIRGEISKHGILTPEGCFDPLPFFEEMSGRSRALSPETPLVVDSLEQLGEFLPAPTCVFAFRSGVRLTSRLGLAISRTWVLGRELPRSRLCGGARI